MSPEVQFIRGQHSQFYDIAYKVDELNVPYSLVHMLCSVYIDERVAELDRRTVQVFCSMKIFDLHIIQPWLTISRLHDNIKVTGESAVLHTSKIKKYLVS